MNTSAALTRSPLQRSLCLLLSISLVSIALTTGALGVQSMVPHGYSVTITQLS